jgi:hypothetical protein
MSRKPKPTPKEDAEIVWGIIAVIILGLCLLSAITDSIVKIIEAIKK